MTLHELVFNVVGFLEQSDDNCRMKAQLTVDSFERRCVVYMLIICQFGASDTLFLTMCIDNEWIVLESGV